MPKDTFLLAHLSDVHLAPMPGLPLSHINVKRALGAANWWRHRRHVHTREVLDAIVADMHAQHPHHVAVTGDLVNLGLPAEHEAALRWLEMLGPPSQVSVVPGNHDAYVRMRGDKGHRRWDAYMEGDGQQGNPEHSRAGTGFPFMRRRGPIALIGLSSGVPTKPFFSAGHLGAAQVMSLQEKLVGAQLDGLVRIVAIHHPPFRYPQEWRTGLKDAAALAELLRVTGADMVLHGHFHRAQEMWIDGIAGRVAVLGVPSASAAIRYNGADLAGYNLYAISRANGGETRIEMIRRGIAEPGGPVVELDRKMLTTNAG